MFIPFNITTNVINQVTSNGNFDYDTSYIKKKLEANINKDSIRQRLIDGTKLQEEWFPSECFDSQFDVFISHAHKDETVVKKLAGFLYKEYGLRCFIDSCYWSYANNLLIDLNDIYSAYTRCDGTKAYRYGTSTFMAANVHIMLSMALLKMMDSCECLIFVDSDNSLNYKKGQPATPSPWIYEEIGFSNRLRINIPDRFKDRVRVRICESRDTSHIGLECFSADGHETEFNYRVNMNNFESLTSADFPLKRLINKSTDVLDRWYSKYGVGRAIKHKFIR